MGFVEHMDVQVSAVARPFWGIEGGMGITCTVHVDFYHPVRVDNEIPDIIEAETVDCL